MHVLQGCRQQRVRRQFRPQRYRRTPWVQTKQTTSSALRRVLSPNLPRAIRPRAELGTKALQIHHPTITSKRWINHLHWKASFSLQLFTNICANYSSSTKGLRLNFRQKIFFFKVSINIFIIEIEFRIP